MVKEYTCTSCGWYKEFELREKTPTPCPECGSNGCRIVFREQVKSKGSECGFNAFKENIRWSWSLGINPDDAKQVAAAKIRHPGAEFNESGQMKINNRTEKVRRMREAGVSEYESKK